MQTKENSIFIGCGQLANHGKLTRENDHFATMEQASH